MRTHFAVSAVFAASLSLASARFAGAHGIVGDRFFPPTISTDDPFAVDELAFPTISTFKNSRDGSIPSSREINAGFEFDKEIFPHLSLGVSQAFILQNPSQGPAIHGWSNLGINVKDEVWWNDFHEAIVSVGLHTDIGGTGSRSIRDSRTTFTPTVYFGKGFGDLPDSFAALKPFAITGTLGQTIPTRSQDPHTFEYSFALEYSLPYLQQHVADIGLPPPLKDMILLVEFPFASAEDRGAGGQTTGSINPGVLWETPYLQIGAEAIIPVNGRSGDGVGVTVQMWIFIDDLFPNQFGHPVFGGTR